MNSNNKKVLEALVARAQAGKHVEFKLIQTYKEYLHIKVVLAGTVGTVKKFRRAAKILFKEYCRLIMKNIDSTQSLELMVNIRTFFDCVRFYEEEANIIYSMIYEFQLYKTGRFTDVVLLNKKRPEDLQFNFTEELEKQKVNLKDFL